MTTFGPKPVPTSEAIERFLEDSETREALEHWAREHLHGAGAMVDIPLLNRLRYLSTFHATTPVEVEEEGLDNDSLNPAVGDT